MTANDRPAPLASNVSIVQIAPQLGVHPGRVRMKPLLLVLSCSLLACASVTDRATQAPDTPGGECAWSVTEGGGECVVWYSGSHRHRIPGKTGAADIEGVEFYSGERKWKCGEKRPVCGSIVECTCPYPVSSDGQR